MGSAGKRLLAIFGLLATFLTPAAHADVVKGFQQNYHKVVYGDFLYAGNSVVQCATGDAECAKAANRETKERASDFALRWSDVDGDAETFDSATASVTIPPGAKVAFARLSWGGSLATTCPRPPGEANTQAVRFWVGSGEPADVSPGSFEQDAQFYSAHADVTGQFANAPTGTPVTLTAGNVWTAAGRGCGGGWSVAVVFAYPGSDPQYAPAKRAVYVYDGHEAVSANGPAATTTVTGFRAASADAHVGVTAEGGDWGTTGDRFLINGKPIAEPGTGAPDNFFIASTDNAVKPGAKNSFGVDAKALSSDAVPSGATSAKLAFSTTGDDFAAQNLVFSVPVPDLQLVTHVDPPRAHAGDQVTVTVGVTNPNDTAAHDVEVTDDRFPACAKKIGTLAAGATTGYQCPVTAPGDDVTSAAKVTGTSTLGDALDGTAATRVDVVHPAISLAQQVDKPAYRAGDPVTFTVTATNTGDVPLHDVAVTDVKVGACARTIGTLAPRQQTTATCQAKAPVPETSASAAGTDPLGKVVTAVADVKVPVIAPAIDITKTVDPAVVHAGDPVTWTITVRNTGDSPLNSIDVTDASEPACSRTFGALAPGAQQSWPCAEKPALTTTNTVTATGTDLSGQPVTDTASATAKVIHPALSLTKTSAPAQVREGDRVTFTVTLKNTGDAPLDDVAVADDRTPGCVRKFGTLAPRAEQTYRCDLLAPQDDLTDPAVATGKDELGRELSGTADSTIDVIHPALAVTQSAAPAQVREGDHVTFSVTVSNTGDTPLHDVGLAATRVPGCAKPVGSLPPRGKQTLTCTTVAGKDGFTNSATATGTDPTNRPVTASADASFAVQHPAVTLAATVQGGPFREHDNVPVRVTVKNTGDVPLTEVHVTADACTQDHDPLPASAIWTFTCTTNAPADDVTESLTVTATPPMGPVVTANAEAVVDVIHPAVAITQTVAPAVVRPGEPATFTVTATNTGDVELHDVSVADTAAPECAKRLGTLSPQAKQTYTCTHATGDDLASASVVTSTDPANRPVTATADAHVDVIHPAIAISQTVAPQQVREGDPVTFTITVRNSGDVPLTRVSVADDRTNSCARPATTLVAGATENYTCSTKAGRDGYTNSVRVTGTDPLGGTVTAAAEASFTVLHPGLSLTRAVHGGPFRAGDAVTTTLTVTNTGDTPVTKMRVTDDQVPVCAKTFDTLAPSAKQSYDCTSPAPADDAVFTARVTGAPTTGAALTATADATIDVIHPALTVKPAAAPPQARAGDDVTVTVVVTNTGDVPLTKITLTGCPKDYDRLGPGAAETYACRVKAASDDFTATVNATANDPTTRPVTASGVTKVDVIHPELAIMTDAEPYQVRQGDTVTFSVLVKNVGDTPLTDVSVVDDHTPACGRHAGRLIPDAEETYSCTTTAGATGFTSTTSVTGTDPAQRAVTASAQASFAVLKPKLTLAKHVDGGPFRPGDSVRFDVVLTNTGDTELHDVHVTDPGAPECARTFATLPVNGIRRYPCTTTAAGTAIDSTQVTATPLRGTPVMTTADAKIDVIHPNLEITNDHLRQPIRPGDPVTYLTTVRNTGDATLTDVIVRAADPTCAFTVSELPPGETTVRACTRTVRVDLVEDTTATAHDPAGHTLTATTTATTEVIGSEPAVVPRKTPAKPALALTEEADPTANPGDTVTFLVTATNTGTAPLTVQGLRLDPGDHREWTRTAIAPRAGTLADKIAVTAHPDTLSGQEFTEHAQTVVKIVSPEALAKAPADPLPGPDPDPWIYALNSLSLLAAGGLFLRITRQPRPASGAARHRRH
ncbi:DUF11 domain-containing protein [Amycolatopsis sp. FDAARGOS 1241]|uniref:DUF7507 domain-containing protein n=1 Tax=Amycolatopsis sp. FDAARGOS 1241 TaxID=2778070 RepID=UPI0019517C6C|nr:DUF11 domain-containing protein [Amycolatopsis sp. FDAARGOS 1241]QRP46214.1 DUF11 domain-containing protein [Amycolatopsis sp. FDAARGOS 1241]